MCVQYLEKYEQVYINEKSVRSVQRTVNVRREEKREERII
jgi:hypothetical protein